MSNAQLRYPAILLTALLLCASNLHAAGFNDLYLGTGAGNPGGSTGNRNTALGEGALASNTSGSDNTAVGNDACFSTTSAAPTRESARSPCSPTPRGSPTRRSAAAP